MNPSLLFFAGADLRAAPANPIKRNGHSRVKTAMSLRRADRSRRRLPVYASRLACAAHKELPQGASCGPLLGRGEQSPAREIVINNATCAGVCVLGCGSCAAPSAKCGRRLNSVQVVHRQTYPPPLLADAAGAQSANVSGGYTEETPPGPARSQNSPSPRRTLNVKYLRIAISSALLQSLDAL